MSLTEQIENGMGFHPGNADVAPLYEEMRVKFKVLALHVNSVVPDGRDKSLAITYLKDAFMWAIRGIAINMTPLGDERR